MDGIRTFVSLMVEKVISEEDIDEMSGASAISGYVLPLGAKPTVIDPEKPKPTRRKKRRGAKK